MSTQRRTWRGLEDSSHRGGRARHRQTPGRATLLGALGPRQGTPQSSGPPAGRALPVQGPMHTPRAVREAAHEGGPTSPKAQPGPARYHLPCEYRNVRPPHPSCQQFGALGNTSGCSSGFTGSFPLPPRHRCRPWHVLPVFLERAGQGPVRSWCVVSIPSSVKWEETPVRPLSWGFTTVR